MKRRGYWWNRAVSVVLCMSIAVTGLPLRGVAAEESTAPPTQDIVENIPPEEELIFPIVEEIPEKRDAYSKHFMLEDRSYLAAVYNEEVHYFEDGEWKDIDNTLQWDPMLCVYRNTAGEAEVHFAENSGQDQLVLVERDGFSVSWNISPKTFESVQPELLDRKQLASMPDFLGDSLQSGETQSALKKDRKSVV